VKTDDLHQHIDKCHACRSIHDDYTLCEFGQHLFKEAVAELEMLAANIDAPRKGLHSNPAVAE
jgi:hypothetical protein